MNTRPQGLKIGYWWVERALASLATTINISRDERRFAINTLGLGRAKALIAANPVDLVRFRPTNADRRRQLRGKWNIPASAIVFGTLARFSAQKDLGTFYRAAIRCAKVSADLHFIHLGAGKEIEFFKNEVTQTGVFSQFTFIEYLADTEPFFACLDAFVLTSRFEAGWPIVMLEALALGLPVVTTDFVGLSANDSKDLSHADVVPVGDAEKLAERMLMRADSIRVEKQATNHRSYVETHFAPNVCYGKVEQLYAQLAAPIEVI
jgi:glycosyltransferase involved in cell wall biosynthesis